MQPKNNNDNVSKKKKIFFFSFHMRDDNGSKMSGIDMALRGQRYQWRYVTFSHAAIEDEKTIGCKKSTSEFRHQFSVDYFDGRPCRVLLSLHPI